jgi:hypothetical protein
MGKSGGVLAVSYFLWLDLKSVCGPRRPFVFKIGNTEDAPFFANGQGPAPHFWKKMY